MNTNTTPRPDVVRLLTETDLGTVLNAASPASWARHDGTPLTADEAALVAGANRRELLAGRAITEARMEQARAETADMTRVMELTERHFNELGAGATMGDVYKVMPEGEQAELTELLNRLTPAATIDVPGLIETAGRELADNMVSAGGYTDGHESTLAKRLIASTDDTGRDTLLEHLVHDKLDELIDVDCLLDQTERSYDATAGMADFLIAEIRRQDNVEAALHELVTDAIVRECKYTQRQV